MATDGALILIELKRDRTPREVVAQALDYACWVEGLKGNDIAAIYARFAPGRDLAADFQDRFGQPLDEDTLNESHQIVIVATHLDESSERIVKYLGDKGIPINVLSFQVFDQRPGRPPRYPACRVPFKNRKSEPGSGLSADGKIGKNWQSIPSLLGGRC